MDTLLKAPIVIVALPQLQDPNFRRAVILIIEHNTSGAMGFIINRPSQMPVRELILLKDLDIPNSIPAWFGGPVGTDNGLVLRNHNGREDVSDCAETKTFKGHISVSSSISCLKEMIKISTPQEREASENKLVASCLYPYRFLVGYAGWGPRQLEDEFKLGAWLQLPADNQLLFNTPWQRMWEAAIESIGVDPASLVPTQSSYLN